MKLRLLIILIFTFSTAYSGQITDEIVRSDANLSKIKRMINQESKSIRDITNKKKIAAKNLKKAELELRYHKKLSKVLEKNLKKLQREQSDLRFKKTLYKNRKNKLIDEIKSANFYLAGAGETDLLEALILADEISELTASLQIISRVNQSLFDKVEELDNVQKQLEESSAKLLIKEEEVLKSLNEKNESIKEHKKKQMLVKQLYKIAEEDENIKKEYVAMLEQKQSQLEKKMKSLEILKLKQDSEKRFDGLGKQFKHNKGKLDWPVNGDIIEKFGKKKVKGFRGVVHKKGIKIIPKDSFISSIYDGVVIHTDTSWGLGWFVIIEHSGGYYSLYANMDDIKVRKNQKVHTGEILGTIDIDHEINTPYLYFEIRIHDKAVDPIKWLAS